MQVTQIFNELETPNPISDIKNQVRMCIFINVNSIMPAVSTSSQRCISKQSHSENILVKITEM